MIFLSMSDIHIRNNSRDAEYKTVFDRVYKTIEQEKVDLVLIAGDIFHHKSLLTPESILIARDYFIELANRAEVCIIAGNHDIGKDFNRTDAVDAIVKTINAEHFITKYPIHYYKNSGVYPIERLNVQMAIWDFRDTHHTVQDKDESAIMIGMYHGAPRTMYQNSIEFKSIIDYDVFKNVDYLVCGDIHKREFFDNAKHRFMVGSLICQTFTEENFPHGVVIVDTIKDQVKEIEIKNDFGFVTLIDQDFSVTGNSAVLNKKIEFSEFNLRCRLINEYTPDQIIAIKSLIKKKLKKDITIQVYVDAQKDVKEFGNINISDINVQNTLIEEFCTVNKIANISEILNINTEINKEIKHNDNLYYVKWKPVELRFKNVFSFGEEENVIDFSKLSGITSIIGSNGTGKSSILSAMLFSLFSKTPKISTMEEVINDRKNDAWMQFTISVDGELYRITKELVRKKSKVTSSISFEKYNTATKEFEIDTTKYTAGKDDTKTDTKQMINKILGNYDDVLISTFSLQEKSSMYINAGEPERRSYVYDFIGLNIFELLFVSSAKYETKYKNIIDSFKDVDIEEQIDLADYTATECSNSIIKITDDIAKEEELINEMDKRIIQKSTEKSLLKDKMTNFAEMSVLDKKISTNKFEIEKNNAIVDKCKLSLHNITLQLAELTKVDVETKTAQCDRQIIQCNANVNTANTRYEELVNAKIVLESKQSANKAVNIKLVTLESKIKQLTINIANYKRQSEILLKQSWMRELDNCKTCLLAIDAFNADAELTKCSNLKNAASKMYDSLSVEYNTELDDQVSDATKHIVKELSEINLLKDSISELQNKKEALTGISVKVIAIEAEIEKINTNIFVLTEKNNNLSNEIKELSDKISNYGNLNEIKVKYDNIQLEINDFDSDKTIHKNKIKTFRASIDEHNMNIGNLTAKKEALLKSKVEYEDAMHKYLVYKDYRKIVHKNGLPFATLHKFIPILNQKIKEYLTEDLVNFNLKFEIENDKLKILVQKYGEGWRDIKSAGGHETIICSWVIRAILSEFSILPKADLFILDEGFGAFDQSNSGNINMLFEKFKLKFDKILVISHVPIVADFSDNIIELMIDADGYSNVRIR